MSISAVFRPRRALPLVGALLLGLAAAPPAMAERLTLTYRIYVGGVSVLDADAELVMAGGRYRVAISAATEGFLRRLAPWDTRSESAGQIGTAGPRPEAHVVSSTWRGKPRSVTLAYNADGTVTATAEPSADEDDREPVPAALTVGTLDPLSAFVAMMHGAAQGAGCGMTVPVFDGRRRYDLLFTAHGTRSFEASDRNAFSGEAAHCRVTWRSIAGHSRGGGERSQFWRRGEGQTERPPVDVWLARVSPNGPPAPVRASTDSPMGGVVIHLTGITVHPQAAEGACAKPC